MSNAIVLLFIVSFLSLQQRNSLHREHLFCNTKYLFYPIVGICQISSVRVLEKSGRFCSWGKSVHTEGKQKRMEATGDMSAVRLKSITYDSPFGQSLYKQVLPADHFFGQTQ